MKPRTKWTKKTFTQEIIKISSDGIAPAVYKNNVLRGAAERLFGSWVLALRYAGLKPFADRPFNDCLVDCCHDKERNRGSLYCEKHYYQKRRTGDTATKIDMVRHKYCLYCGTKLGGRQRKHCSVRCSTRTYRKNDRFKKCVICGLGFEPKNNGIDKKTCSDKCSTEHQKAERFKKSNSPACYDTYAEKLDWCDDVKKSDEGFLKMSCVYCGKWFAPTNNQVRSRVAAVNGTMSGDLRVYCSDACKKACPIYRTREHYKGSKIGGTREVPAEFRHIALADRKHTCERCGSKEDGLHVHHIEGYTEQPLLSADLVNVLVVCPPCHKQIHKKKGCSYFDYRCNKDY